jgi:hypothetical protein
VSQGMAFLHEREQPLHLGIRPEDVMLRQAGHIFGGGLSMPGHLHSQLLQYAAVSF